MGVIWRLLRLGIAIFLTTIATVLLAATHHVRAYGGGSALPAGDRPAIILGAGLERDGQLTRATKRRVALGVALLRTNKATVLIMSQGPTGRGSTPGAALMAELAIAAGAPASAVLEEGRATSTFENLRFSAATIRDQSLGEPILVTDAYHMPRARALAAYLGVKLSGYATSDRLSVEGLRMQVRVVIREAMAWWHNLGRCLIWSALGALGYSDDARDRMLV